jgi:hypothetical protein
MSKRRLTREQRRNWRELPYEDWNVITFHAYFADMNREYYGVDTYIPCPNWRAEQGAIKRSITQYGAEVLRKAFDIVFKQYRPTREYPILTAGFAISYRINTILPRIIAEERDKNRNRPSDAEVMAWL